MMPPWEISRAGWSVAVPGPYPLLTRQILNRSVLDRQMPVSAAQHPSGIRAVVYSF